MTAISAQAQVQIKTTVDTDSRFQLAIPSFLTDTTTLRYGKPLHDILARDFEFMGEFVVVPSSEYPTSFRGLTSNFGGINFESWRNTKSQYLVHTTMKQEGAKMVAEFRLFDILVSQQVVGKRFGAKTTKDARLLSHMFADESVRFLTGVAGIASTEVAFSGGKGKVKEIYIGDYDGGTITQVTHHGSISIRPEFSPDGTKIAYLSYKDRFPFLYIYDRRTGKSTALSTRSGLNHAPAWAPDSSRIALTLSKDGNTEIYTKNPDGSGERRLTNDRASDTSPVYSPDGTKIAFISDRAGRPQIFTMNTDGSNVRRITSLRGSAYDPAWSPDGQRIAYIEERLGEGLELYIIRPDGSNARQLSFSGGSNESPTWSPDSRHIMFGSTRGGTAQLYTATLATGIVQIVPRLSHLKCEGPSWGPRRLPIEN
jgi:TolB protein